HRALHLLHPLARPLLRFALAILLGYPLRLALCCLGLQTLLAQFLCDFCRVRPGIPLRRLRRRLGRSTCRRCLRLAALRLLATRRLFRLLSARFLAGLRGRLLLCRGLAHGLGEFFEFFCRPSACLGIPSALAL